MEEYIDIDESIKPVPLTLDLSKYQDVIPDRRASDASEDGEEGDSMQADVEGEEAA